MSEEINVDDLVEALPDERKVIAFQRAAKRMGIKYELQPGGIGITIVDEDIYSTDALMESDEFSEAFADELKRLIVMESLNELMAKGLVEPHGVDDDGNTLYTLTEFGKSLEL